MSSPSGLTRSAVRDRAVPLLSFAVGAVFVVVLASGALAAEPTTAHDHGSHQVAPGDEPTKGLIPSDATLPDGSPDFSQFPDFVPASDRDGNIAGYVPVRAVFIDPNDDNLPIPVFAEDLSTLVGHMVPDFGFVALDESIESMEALPIETPE